MAALLVDYRYKHERKFQFRNQVVFREMLKYIIISYVKERIFNISVTNYFVRCSSSSIFMNTMFRRLDLFLSSGVMMEPIPFSETMHLREHRMTEHV
jgi:hypothetical protein